MIKTKSRRVLKSRVSGAIEIEHTFVDEPASLDTWIKHCEPLAKEAGISVLDVHRILFRMIPEIFGS